MRPLSVGLVGLGRMGRRHLRVLAAQAHVQVAWAFDPVEQPPATVEMLEASGTRYLRSEREALDAEADVIVVAVPTLLHCQVASKFLAPGRTMLIEKPLAATVTEAAGLLDEAGARETSVFVGHVERFNPAVVTVGQLISAGGLGAPLTFSFRRVGLRPAFEPDTDVLSDLGVHDFDVCSLLLGRPLEVLSAVAWPTTGLAHAAQVQCRSGELAAHFQVNWRTPTRIREFTLTTEDCLIEVDYTNQSVEVVEQVAYAEIERFSAFQSYYGSSRRVRLEVPTLEPLMAQAEALVARARGETPTRLTSGPDALAAVQVAERARGMAQQP